MEDILEMPGFSSSTRNGFSIPRRYYICHRGIHKFFLRTGNVHQETMFFSFLFWKTPLPVSKKGNSIVFSASKIDVSGGRCAISTGNEPEKVLFKWNIEHCSLQTITLHVVLKS